VNKKHIRVAVGVIENINSEVLIARRQVGQHLAGLWEFPGGKVEAEESGECALARELKEELDIDVTSSEYLFNIDHEYSEKKVSLIIYKVTQFLGEARGVEGQEVRWVKREALKNYQFPEANKQILDNFKP